MTPKEIAKELSNKYWDYLYDNIEDAMQLGISAKQCALICVDEILKATEACYIDKDSLKKTIEQSKYWQEVKQEISKL